MTIETQGMTPLIQVLDMQKSLAFYCDLLGFELIDKAGPPDDIGWVMLKLNETFLMLNTQYEMHDRPATPDGQRCETHRDTCFYFMCVDSDDVYDHIVQHGIKIDKPTVAPYGMKQLYFTDPDGYNICFQSIVPVSDHK